MLDELSSLPASLTLVVTLPLRLSPCPTSDSRPGCLNRFDGDEGVIGDIGGASLRLPENARVMSRGLGAPKYERIFAEAPRRACSSRMELSVDELQRERRPRVSSASLDDEDEGGLGRAAGLGVGLGWLVGWVRRSRPRS